jgi:hypothetical protein
VSGLTGHIQTGSAITGTGFSGGPGIILNQQSGATVGGAGTYAISAGSGSGTWTTTQRTTIQAQVIATDAVILQYAPIINSPFAINYATASPLGYLFPAFTQSFAFGTASGIDLMTKFYNGHFYIFAGTRNPESDINISATFTIADTNATSITVVNDGNRSISASGGTFTDTFPNAWSHFIYRVN